MKKSTLAFTAAIITVTLSACRVGSVPQTESPADDENSAVIESILKSENEMLSSEQEALLDEIEALKEELSRALEETVVSQEETTEEIEPVTEPETTEEIDPVTEPETTAETEPVTEAETTTETEPVTEDETDADSALIRPEIKEAIDSYEAFINEYCEFMESYDAGDFTLLSKYMDLLQKEVEYSRNFAEIGNYDLTIAEAAYYEDVSLRCAQRMLETASKIN